MADQEKEYYRSGNVLITNTRAELGGRTFAMANVTAVSMATTGSSTFGPAVLLAAAVLVGSMGLSRGGAQQLVVGAVMAALAIWWIRSLKPTYSVNLGSASGESKALQSQNKAEIEQVVAAIQQAIIERG